MNQIINIKNSDQILEVVKKEGLMIIDDCIDLKLLSELQNFWIEFFSKKNIKAFKSRNIYGYSQTLGDLNFNSLRKEKSVYILRNKQYLWNRPIHKPTVEIANQMNKYRNLTLGLSEDHGFTYSESRQSNFTQVNCYPNQGFYPEHSDLQHRPSYSDKVLLNCMFNITFRGTHFEEGGLFLRINEKKIDIDNLIKPGSVIFYNGNLKHGVDRISSKAEIGRIAGYPSKQFFLNSDYPYYLKFLNQANIAIRRRLGLSTIAQGNSSIVR